MSACMPWARSVLFCLVLCAPALVHAPQQMDGEPEPPDWVTMTLETTPTAGALAALVCLPGCS